MGLFDSFDFGNYHSRTNSADYTVVGNISQKSNLPKIDLKELILPESEEKNDTGLDGFERTKKSENEEIRTQPIITKKIETKESKKEIPFVLDRSNSTDTIVTPKYDTKSKSQTVKIKGKDVKVNLESLEEQKDGTWIAEGKSEDGKTSMKSTINLDGSVKYQEVVYKFTNGNTRTEFYSDEGEVVVKGYRETYKDEDGIERAYAYNEMRDKKNGTLLRQNIMDDNDTEGSSEMYQHVYDGNVGLNSNIGSNKVHTYAYGEDRIQHCEGGRMTESGFEKDECKDYISVAPMDKPFSDDLIPTSAITNALPNVETLKPDNVNTCVDDILAAGGEITHDMTIGGVPVTKREFAQESSQNDTESGGMKYSVTTGYTKTDENGIITEHYKVSESELELPSLGSETFKEYRDFERVVEIIKYDEETGLHYGKKQIYQQDGAELKLVATYYMQGDIEKGMRYTEVVKNENGELISLDDFVQFKSGKTFSTEELLPYAQE